MLELDSDAVVPRSQAAGPAARDRWRDESATVPAVGDEENRTDPSFERDADVNIVLARFGAGHPLPRGMTRFEYGVVQDDSVDLRAMYADVATIVAAWGRAPALFKKAYPTPEALFHALSVGDVDATLWREEAAPVAAADPKPAASAGAAPAP